MRTYLVAFSVSLFAGTLYGGTVQSVWDGPLGGNWSTAANWFPATVPNNSKENTYNVFVDTFGYPPPVNVLLDTSPTINSLVLSFLGDTAATVLADTAGRRQTLTINGPLTLNPYGSLILHSSVVNADSLVLNGGYQFGMSGAVIGSGATLNLHNGITDVPQASYLDVSGALTSNETSALAGLSTIEGQLFLENGQSTTITPKSGNLFISQGVFSVIGPGTSATVVGNITNAGSLSPQAQASLTVTGNITDQLNSYGSEGVAQGGNLTVGGTLTTRSTFVIDGSAKVKELVSNGYTQVDQGGTLKAIKITNAGYLPIHADGTVVVGSGSLPTSTTGYYQFANGTLAEVLFPSVIGNTCRGSSDCGLIVVAGPAHLNGTLDPVLADGFDPANGEAFIFMTFTPGELTGEFSNIADKYFNNHTQEWVVTYGSSFVELSAEAYATPEPANLLLMVTGLAGIGIFAHGQSRRRRS